MIKISSIESYLPAKILTNDDLAKIVDTSHEWIYERTGIEQRHVVDGECASDLGVQAAQKALLSAGVLAKDIDAVIVSTCTGDTRFPSCACKIQGAVGAVHAFAFDINAACGGFLYGLSVADSMMKSMGLKNVLLIAVDTLSLFVDWTDRATCVLFGDGAGAVVLQNSSDENGVIATKLYADGGGDNAKYIMLNNGPQNDHRGYTSMSGQAVFKHAIESMSLSMNEILQENNMTMDDIDWIVPHQANRRIIESMCKLKGFPMEKVVMTIHEHANTSSASIPLAIRAALDENKIKKGDTLLLTAFGAGLVWASAIIKI